MKLYYFIVDNELYAWTFNKVHAKKFKEQRNEKIVIKKEIDVDIEDNDKRPSQFISNKEITYDFVFDGKRDIQIYLTLSELAAFNESIENLYATFDAIIVSSDKYPLKEEICEFIKEVTSILSEGPGQYALNTYKIFYELFRYTLTGVKLE